MSKHHLNQITRVKEVPLSLLREIIEETGAIVNKVEPERNVIHFVIEYPSVDDIDDIIGKGLSVKPENMKPDIVCSVNVLESDELGTEAGTLLKFRTDVIMNIETEQEVRDLIVHINNTFEGGSSCGINYGMDYFFDDEDDDGEDKTFSHLRGETSLYIEGEVSSEFLYNWVCNYLVATMNDHVILFESIRYKYLSKYQFG